ncbi:polyprenyl synthetase family protein [Desulfotignum balticum]|jgi:octaprenyl-diphosphate synthase|uniref:polyprenyl synthetase family protein n=1 Tax=Desulfotignum balticum TaxID=115781 RepID=UPI0003FBE848|nr:polyprenyl synthetase family protein [Desulfotignum balticum]
MKTDLKTQILAQVTPDLNQVEQALEENLAPRLDLVKQIAAHLLFSGGKRLRPLLFIHAARMCGYRGGHEVMFSTMFEYLHAATLLHDDVVDGSALRRGRDAAHTLWPAAQVVLTGDFLLARALDIAARTNNSRVIAVIAEITREMSEGEIDQLDKKGRIDLTEAQYMKIIERKTAVLIQGACRCGAILAHASDAKENALADFGFHVGMAFQMADDLLDYTATATQLGKNPGADLREGKLTLPMIYSLAHAGARDRKWMEQMLSETAFDPVQFQVLKEKLESLDGISYTQNKAKEDVAKAEQALTIFNASASKTILTLIANYAVHRKV